MTADVSHVQLVQIFTKSFVLLILNFYLHLLLRNCASTLLSLFFFINLNRPLGFLIPPGLSGSGVGTTLALPPCYATFVDLGKSFCSFVFFY
jgi:hypothetical protein